VRWIAPRAVMDRMRVEGSLCSARNERQGAAIRSDRDSGPPSADPAREMIAKEPPGMQSRDSFLWMCREKATPPTSSAGMEGQANSRSRGKGTGCLWWGQVGVTTWQLVNIWSPGVVSYCFFRKQSIRRNDSPGRPAGPGRYCGRSRRSPPLPSSPSSKTTR
jgi:hypothetical protein